MREELPHSPSTASRVGASRLTRSTFVVYRISNQGRNGGTTEQNN